MTDELLDKIQRLLHRQIRNEMQVVYLLVELRKLMDRDNYLDPLLRTFTNWVVHTGLETPREGSTLILTEFDEFIRDIFEEHKKMVSPEHLNLMTFYGALAKCFEHFKLTARFTSSGTDWKRFTKLYCAIVGDCPIVFKASKTQLKYVKQVELVKTNRGLIVRGLPDVQWKLTL